MRESIGYQLTGLFVVCFALCLIWLLMEAVGACFKRFGAGTRTGQVVEGTSSSVVSPLSGSVDGLPGANGQPVDPTVYVLVAAAVHCVLAGKLRIVAIQPLPDQQDWSREGRREIFSSHKTR